MSESDGMIATASGAPFKDHKAAVLMMGRRKLTRETHEIVSWGSGFVIRPKAGVSTAAQQEPPKPQAEASKKKEYVWCVFGARGDGPTERDDIFLNPNAEMGLHFRRNVELVAPRAHFEAAKDAVSHEILTVNHPDGGERGFTVSNTIPNARVSYIRPATEAEFQEMLKAGEYVSRRPFAVSAKVQQAMTQRMLAGVI